MADGTVEFGTSVVPEHPDGRLDGPAFHRNHAAIWPVLESFLRGRSGDVLEIGSGTGQHAVEFARTLPAIIWWPTDVNDSHLRSIAAWRAHSKLVNLQPPVRLDASERTGDSPNLACRPCSSPCSAPTSSTSRPGP